MVGSRRLPGRAVRYSTFLKPWAGPGSQPHFGLLNQPIAPHAKVARTRAVAAAQHVLSSKKQLLLAPRQVTTWHSSPSMNRIRTALLAALALIATGLAPSVVASAAATPAWITVSPTTSSAKPGGSVRLVASGPGLIGGVTWTTDSGALTSLGATATLRPDSVGVTHVTAVVAGHRNRPPRRRSWSSPGSAVSGSGHADHQPSAALGHLPTCPNCAHGPPGPILSMRRV